MSGTIARMNDLETWIYTVGGTMPSGFDRGSLARSDEAQSRAVGWIRRNVDGIGWLSDSPVRQIALFVELTRDGRRLDGRDTNARVLPERHVASQRIDRSGTVAVWSTISTERLLALPSAASAEAFWTQWIRSLLSEVGQRRGLGTIDKHWPSPTSAS